MNHLLLRELVEEIKPGRRGVHVWSRQVVHRLEAEACVFNEDGAVDLRRVSWTRSMAISYLVSWAFGRA